MRAAVCICCAYYHRAEKCGISRTWYDDGRTRRYFNTALAVQQITEVKRGLDMEKKELNGFCQEAAGNFALKGRQKSCEAYGSGHINDTFCLISEEEGKEYKVILQRMNHEIFKQPVELMENILNVTAYLRRQILNQGGDPERETLNVILSKDGKPYYRDSGGNYWRCYQFIEDAVSFDKVENPQDFYESAVSFGNFQRLLADYPAADLHETIVGFHNTRERFLAFREAVQEDVCGRSSGVQEEIRFVLEREELAGVLVDMEKNGTLPLRVTHNDTKLNNIMMDAKTGKGLCVIDLDTVMPGLAVNDFGDSIRFGASTAAEDEKDLSLVKCDMGLFELYTRGFLQGLNGSLTDQEIRMLPMGAKVMTYECGLRFLMDYLQGDIYFKIHYPEQNLDRSRTQFKLVADMEKKWDEMNRIVRANCDG